MNPNFLNEDGESRDQIKEELDFKVSKKNYILFETHDASKISKEEMISKYDSGSCVCFETS